MTTQTNVLNIKGFHFDDPKFSDEQKMGMVAQFNRVSRAAGEGASGWLLKLAKEFNDPKFGSLAAKKFENRCEELILNVIKNQSTLVGFTLLDSDLKDLKLTGGGLIAAPFRKIYNCMFHGGNLAQMDSVSACQKFAAKAITKQKEDQAAETLRGAAKAKAEHEGLVEGTPEFDAFVDQTMNGGIKAVPGNGTPTNEKPKVHDAITEVLQEMEEIARKSAELFGLEDILAKLVGYHDKMQNRLDSILLQKGLTKPTEEQESAAG